MMSRAWRHGIDQLDMLIGGMEEGKAFLHTRGTQGRLLSEHIEVRIAIITTDTAHTA